MHMLHLSISVAIACEVEKMLFMHDRVKESQLMRDVRGKALLQAKQQFGDQEVNRQPAGIHQRGDQRR